MSNKVKDMDIQNRTHYFFNDMINIKNFDPNNIKLVEKSYKNILIYYIRYVTIKGSIYAKIYCVNFCTIFVPNIVYHIFNKVNGYFEENNGNKCLTLVPTTESNEEIEKYEELWIKIRDLIESITKNSLIMMKNI